MSCGHRAAPSRLAEPAAASWRCRPTPIRSCRCSATSMPHANRCRRARCRNILPIRADASAPTGTWRRCACSPARSACARRVLALEGAISNEALAVIERHGFTWAASSAGAAREPRCTGRRCRSPVPAAGSRSCWFRDDGLSDLIGFTYAGWHGDDAVAHFVGALAAMAERSGLAAPCRARRARRRERVTLPAERVSLPRGLYSRSRRIRAQLTTRRSPRAASSRRYCPGPRRQLARDACD